CGRGGPRPPARGTRGPLRSAVDAHAAGAAGGTGGPTGVEPRAGRGRTFRSAARRRCSVAAERAALAKGGAARPGGPRPRRRPALALAIGSRRPSGCGCRPPRHRRGAGKPTRLGLAGNTKRAGRFRAAASRAGAAEPLAATVGWIDPEGVWCEEEAIVSAKLLEAAR